MQTNEHMDVFYYVWTMNMTTIARQNPSAVETRFIAQEKMSPSDVHSSGCTQNPPSSPYIIIFIYWYIYLMLCEYTFGRYINKDIFSVISLSAHGRTEISSNLYTLPTAWFTAHTENWCHRPPAKNGDGKKCQHRDARTKPEREKWWKARHAQSEQISVMKNRKMWDTVRKRKTEAAVSYFSPEPSGDYCSSVPLAFFLSSWWWWWWRWSLLSSSVTFLLLLIVD